MRNAIAQALPAVVTIIAELPSQAVSGGVLERENFGSGIVVSPRGFVLTNFHVIDGAARLTVALSTGERRPARLVDDDSPFHDLAVLQIAPDGLRAATFGDSDRLRLGDPVAAIAGGLVTFENQAKVGVVSATRVQFPRPGLVMEDVIQTDAAVNHGDSGGALVNAAGEVVGLLTTVVRRTPDGQTVEGVAFAQSANSLRGVVEAIVATGVNPRLRWGVERLGRQHVPVTDEIAAERQLPVQTGALVVGVEPGSPAARAGVQVGDVIVGLNGTLVDDDAPLVNLLRALTGDGRANFTIVRGQRQLNVTVLPVRREARGG
ncbi:MAG: PDZ domain-containing protein [Chloroflexi bacterium]|nr:PDZ domain-containing protein [Chloroflexota bacterium]